MSTRRLFQGGPAPEADVRPTLLGSVSLCFMLLFFLLATSSGVRLGRVDFARATAEPAAEARLPHTGPIDELVVALSPDGTATVRFRVQSTDVAAASTAVEHRELTTRTASDLAAAMERLHALDPAQTRARILPDDDTTTAQLLAALDAVRGPTVAPRFPDVALEGAGSSTP